MLVQLKENEKEVMEEVMEKEAMVEKLMEKLASEGVEEMKVVAYIAYEEVVSYGY